ncbi:hypothetical protein [Cypionkella psychrotolerans]|uniref:hypothetical protein n=1 Tax=Cypionkella psychrotolerans TaxID=1678131 RepID=UPI000A64B176|nr:hypothetical protein [Cypionkella psychrotolerans]
MMTTDTLKPARQGIISLPPARVEQLKALSMVWCLPVADVIGRMIKEQINAGVIPATIAGVNLSRFNGAILFGFDNDDALEMTPDEAAFVVEQLRIRAMPKDSTTRKALNAAVDLVTPEHDFGLRPLAVSKRGTGINVRIGKTMKSFSPALALDLADLIESTAA